MTTTNVDPGLQSVLDNVQVIAASEGGSIRFVESRGASSPSNTRLE